MRTTRKTTVRALAMAAALALAVTGCSSNAGNSEATSGSAGSANVTGSDDQLRVAILVPGMVNDSGYNADAQRTADYITSEFGAEVSLSQSVPVPNQADVYRQYAQQGFDLIIGWGGQFSDGAMEVAESFPDVKFLVTSSGVTNDKNVASMDHAIEDWHFMAGWLQAKLTKSGTVGFVAAQCFPAVAALQHGMEQGARYVNPDIEVLVSFTGDFEDPTKANQAAKALIESGADALSGDLNSAFTGVFEAAKSNGNIPVITEWADNHELAPEVIVSTVLKSQQRFIAEAVESVVDDTFKAEAVVLGVPEDWGPLLSKTDLFPDDLYEESLQVQEKIISGEIEVERDEACA